MSGMGNWLVQLVIFFVVVLISMILHELAHGVVAYWLGDSTAKDEGRLTLNPAKHIDPYMSILVPVFLFMTTGLAFGGAKPVPVNKRNLKYGNWGMALVAVAGPLTNFLLALVFYALGFWTHGFWLNANGVEVYAGLWGEIALSVVYINLMLGVFNLIPIPPLDGSRVLYAIAPDGVRRVMDRMEGWGVLVVMVLALLLPATVTNSILGGVSNAILQAFSWLVGAR